MDAFVTGARCMALQRELIDEMAALHGL